MAWKEYAEGTPQWLDQSRPLSLAPLRFSISVKDASSLAKAVLVLLHR